MSFNVSFKLSFGVSVAVYLLVQEGRRQEAEGRREESLYSKLFNLFQLDTYFRHAVLAYSENAHIKLRIAGEKRATQ